MQKRTFGKFLMLSAIASATIPLSGCGGGSGGGSAISSPTVSADQTAFDSMYLSPSSSFSPSWHLPLIGAPSSATDYFYAHPTTLVLSPFANGAQTPFTSANISIANTLAIPSMGSVSRYLLGGQIVTDAVTTERFSYQGSAVKDEVINSNGVVLYSSIRSAIVSTPLSGLVVASQPNFAHWFNALFSNSSLLTSTATWGAGSAYLEYTATNIADRYRVFDFSTTTTGTSPSPVATGTTIAALMTAGGIASTSDATNYTLANGSISVINGVTTYVASVFRPNVTSNLHRTFYEVGGNVLTGDLLKAGDVLGGNSYRETINGVTSANFSSKYQIRVNQAAISSLKAAVTF